MLETGEVHNSFSRMKGDLPWQFYYYYIKHIKNEGYCNSNISYFREHSLSLLCHRCTLTRHNLERRITYVDELDACGHIDHYGRIANRFS